MKPTTRRTDLVDAHVGNRVRSRRNDLGLSQTNLADKLGVSFQQIQKYETGRNRIGASRLFTLSLALGVEVQFFFDGMAVPLLKPADAVEASEHLSITVFAATADGRELNQAFASLQVGSRKAVIDLVRSLALTQPSKP